MIATGVALRDSIEQSVAAFGAGKFGGATSSAEINCNSIRTAASRTAASSIPGIVARIFSPSISLERAEKARRVPSVWNEGATRRGGAPRRCARCGVVRGITA